jgi:hypothetical protein
MIGFLSIYRKRNLTLRCGVENGSRRRKHYGGVDKDSLLVGHTVGLRCYRLAVFLRNLVSSFSIVWRCDKTLRETEALQGEGAMFLRNVAKWLRSDAAPFPRRSRIPSHREKCTLIEYTVATVGDSGTVRGVVAGDRGPSYSAFKGPIHSKLNCAV